MKKIVLIASLLFLMSSLLSCSDNGMTSSDVPLAGTWVQHSGDSEEAHKTVVFFDSDGRGEIWSTVIDGIGLTEVYLFGYVMTDSETVTINYDKGGVDTLRLSNWQADEVSIVVEKPSRWFADGALIRCDD